MSKTSRREPTRLLDVNVLIALTWRTHIHHDATHQWWRESGRRKWATCALTELAFVRISSNPKIFKDAVRPPEAVKLLEILVGQPGHVFVAGLMPVARAEALRGIGVVGHRQVTDAYLLALAVHHGMRLVTFDRGVEQLLAGTHTRERWVELLR